MLAKKSVRSTRSQYLLLQYAPFQASRTSVTMSVKKKTVKKKTPKKPSSASKKKSAVKKGAAKRVAAARKKSAVKKPATKKKAVAAQSRKSAAKKTQVNKPANKQAVKVKPTSDQSARSATTSGVTKPSGKNIGRKVRTLTGRWAGKHGVIVRQDACLGTYFITFDSYQHDAVYQGLEWGPYFEAQLEFQKK